MQRVVPIGSRRSPSPPPGAMVGLALLLLSGASPVSAEPFTIRSGFASGDNSSASLSAQGDGFTLQLGAASTGSLSNLGIAFCGANPCTPTTLAFDALFTGVLGLGTATFGSLSYENVTFDGQMAIDGGTASVRTRSDGWTVAQTSFVLNALLTGRSSDGTPLFSRTLTGRGQAAVLFGANGSLDSATLAFEDPVPTPEPSTLVLFGLGAGALARSHARRRQAAPTLTP